MTAFWLRKLEAGGVVTIDGATGGELGRRGAPLGPHAWSGPLSLSHPEMLTAVHAEYIAAGAEVVTTNTFATTRFVLDAAGLGDRFLDVNRAAVEAAVRARDACGRDVDIAGSISCLPPGFDVGAYPDVTAERAAYVELATTLAELGVDLLVLEMMEDTTHARRACEAVRSVGLPFWIGVSARIDGAGRLVAYDFPHVALADVLDVVVGFGPAVLNVMHTPTDAVAPALDAAASRWSGFVGAYPELEARGAASPDATPPAPAGPEAFAAEATRWVDAGVRVVGGCCGTTPAHIRALKAALDARPATRAAADSSRGRATE